jgi:hypothetical protein
LLVITIRKCKSQQAADAKRSKTFHFDDSFSAGKINKYLLPVTRFHSATTITMAMISLSILMAPDCPIQPMLISN